MRIAIMQPNYLPWLGYFEMMYHCDTFVVLDDVQYNKKFWRNRNRIRVKDGAMWLTVPVLTKNKFKQSINEVQINHAVRWQDKHIRSLWLNYHRSPYFHKYYCHLEDILTKNNWNYLLDLDMAMLRLLAGTLNINTPLVTASSLSLEQRGEEKIIAICEKLGAQQLYDTYNSRNFIDIDTFGKRGIEVIFQQYRYPQYPQQYKPFLPYMSVIDLLFNCGDESLQYILGRH